MPAADERIYAFSFTLLFTISAVGDKSISVSHGGMEVIIKRILKCSDNLNLKTHLHSVATSLDHGL